LEHIRIPLSIETDRILRNNQPNRTNFAQQPTKQDNNGLNLAQQPTKTGQQQRLPTTGPATTTNNGTSQQQRLPTGPANNGNNRQRITESITTD
jgi:hypothetical protein